MREGKTLSAAQCLCKSSGSALLIGPCVWLIQPANSLMWSCSGENRYENGVLAIIGQARLP